MHRRERCTALLAVGFTTVAITACGGGSSTNGVASKSANGILEAAKKAAESATSVRIDGKGKEGGSPISFDLTIEQGKGAKGTISQGAFSFELIRVGESVYIKGSPAFYSHVVGGEVAKLLQGKWLQGSATSGEFQSLGELSSLQTRLDSLLGRHGKLAKGANSTIAGQKVIAVTDTTQGGSLYVATTGKPYPIEIAKSGSNGGKVSFEDWNTAVSIAAPANAINVEKLKTHS